MKKTLFLPVLLLFFYKNTHAQKQDVDVNQERIFTLETRILDCKYDAQKNIDTQKTAHISVDGSKFEIVARAPNGFVIRFLPWDIKSNNVITRNKAIEFNYIDTTGNPTDKEHYPSESIRTDNDNLKLFYINKDDLISNSVADVPGQYFDIKLGALVVPFKFRFAPTSFSSDFSLGSVLMFQHQNKSITDFNYGFGVGISLSKITLDSFSTGGVVRASTERPAFTPSINLLGGYKLISMTIAAGIDYINEISATEKSWKYNGKPWIGFGFGFSLFTPGGDKALPKADQSK